MATAAYAPGASRRWGWLGALMRSAAGLRSVIFLVLALAAPLANASACSITWNITNDGRTGAYTHALDASQMALCDPDGTGVYTDTSRGTNDRPASIGGTVGVDLSDPSKDVLVYTPPQPTYTGAYGEAWYDVDGQLILVLLNVTYPVPTVSAVTPDSGPAAGGTTVTISGTGFNGTPGVWFGGYPATNVAVVNATTITATSPAGSGTVDVTVTTGGGTSATSAADRFTYDAPLPVIGSITPNAGPTSGGTAVTLAGNNFTGATAVFFGATRATNFTVASDREITAISPPGAPGAVNITVVNPDGASSTSYADQFTYIAAPTVTSVSPNQGSVAGGTSVTLMGTNLSAASEVKFGDTVANITASAASWITVTTPAHAAGTVDVTVTTAGGTSATSAWDQYTYVAGPTLTSASPSSGPTNGGTSVTLSGTNLAGATQVTFGGVSTPVMGGTATSLTVTSPAHAAGSVDVMVVTAGGSATLVGGFQYSNPPPVAGPVNLTVAYNSANNPVTLNLSGGAATSVAVATQASHGTATAVGTTITYTPSVAYAGGDSFTYTATNAGGTSSTATVTVTVVTPTLVMTPANGTALNATVGSAFSQAFGMSGGATPYTFSLVITAGSMPSGMIFNTATGLLSGTPTSAGTVAFNISAADNTSGSAPAPLVQSYTLTATAPMLSLSPGSLPSAVLGTIYTQTLTTSGGSTPYTYSLAGTLPPGIALSSAGVLSGVPTATGDFDFTVTATDSHSFSTSQNYRITINPAAPVARDLQVTTLADRAGVIPLTPGLAGGAPSSVTVGTPPTHGTVVISGTNATYTPAPGYSGSDSFGYTATNASGSSSAVVYLTIQALAPVAGAKSATVPFNTATPIDLATVISGASPSLSISTGPSHGTVTVSGTTVTYTPSAGYVGTDSFDYVASNAGGASAPATVSLTINPGAPVAGAKSATVVFDTATAIDLASVISGGAASSLSVSTQPSHGTVAVSGTTVTYTPASGYSGADSFAYTATNAGGTSAAATVSLTVNPQVPVANPVATTVTAGTGSSFNIALDISGGTPTSVVVVSPPAHGTVTIVSAVSAAPSSLLKAVALAPAYTATYVPNAGYFGTDSFTYTATNAGGTSAPATVRVQVNAPAPTVAPLNATTVSGAPVTVDVGAQASGGPFTGLSIVSQPGDGNATVQGTKILYTPAATFVGNATVVYALSNASGTTQGTLTVTVTARLDASRDPEVSGLVAAQADAARRFASTQLGNFGRRLERLHGNGWAGSDANLNVGANGLGMTLTPRGLTPTGGSHRRAPDGGERDGREGRDSHDGSDGSDGRARYALASNEAEDAATPPPRREAAAGNAQPSRFGYWIDGAISLGERDAQTQQASTDFRTDGVSVGADYRFNDWASLGVGAGYARDVSDVGDNGSRSIGTAHLGALYASLRPAEQWFVDGVFGHGSLDFDLRRYITDTTGFAYGSRGGNQRFGSLATGYETRHDNWMLSPYGRVDVMKARLDGYTESADGVSALRYDEQTVRTTTGALGLRGEMLFATRLGRLMPRLRLEYQHRFEGADSARMSYADIAGLGPVYQVNPTQTERNQFILGLGGAMVLRSAISISLDYGATLNNGDGYSQAINARIDMPF